VDTKNFKVEVFEGAEKIDTAFISAKQKVKAMRIAILMTADHFEMKTSELTAKAEVTDEKLNPTDFFTYAGIMKSDVDIEEPEETEPAIPEEKESKDD